MYKYGTGFHFLLIKGNQCHPNFYFAEIDTYWDGRVTAYPTGAIQNIEVSSVL
jgi:hypothetical protein